MSIAGQKATFIRCVAMPIKRQFHFASCHSNAESQCRIFGGAGFGQSALRRAPGARLSAVMSDESPRRRRVLAARLGLRQQEPRLNAQPRWVSAFIILENLPIRLNDLYRDKKWKK